MILGFIIGVAVGFAVTHLWHCRPPKAVAASESAQPVETYGHPFDPVAAVRAKLVPPPRGHMWELGVQYNLAGEPMLTLGLLNLVDNAIVTSIQKNLHWHYPNSRITWAASYESYFSIAKDEAHQELVTPLVQWARTEVNKLDKRGVVERHDVIG